MVAQAGFDLSDLVPRFRSSDLGDADLTDIARRVDGLCSAYSAGDPTDLREQAESVLTRVDQLLGNRLTLTDHRLLLEQAGWLVLLAAALSYDLGHAAEAEQARQLALAIGDDLSSPSILGWAHETGVWIEISNSNWQAAIDKAAIGIAAAGEQEPTGVAIQLSLEWAEAAIRSGDAPAMAAALTEARRHLAQHPPPANPKNHFAFDHAKFDLREMRILLIAGQDDEAEQIALRLKTELEAPDGTSGHPMRTSEILASLGLIEARRGNLDWAVELGNEAIDIGRRSRLSFRQITAALADELAKHKQLSSVDRFLERRADTLRNPE